MNAAEDLSRAIERARRLDYRAESKSTARTQDTELVELLTAAAELDDALATIVADGAIQGDSSAIGACRDAARRIRYNDRALEMTAELAQQFERSSFSSAW